jgi:hypothetical protein
MNHQKRILIFYVITCLLLLSGCKKKKVEESPKIATSIFVQSENDIVTLDLEEFRLSDLKVLVKYNDDSEEVIPVTIDMITQADFGKLFTTGEHFVTIKYANLEVAAIIEVTSKKGLQNRLPIVTLYNLTMELDNQQTKNVFYTIGSGTYASFQLQYQYDTTLVTDITITKADNLAGSFVSYVQNGLITISYTSFTRVGQHSQLFTIDFKTDKIGSYFKLSDNFDNAFYDYNDNNPNVFKLLGNIVSYNR